MPPQYAFEMSMLEYFCGLHSITQLAAFFIDPRAK